MKIRKLETNKLFLYILMICLTGFFGFYIYFPFGKVLYGTDYAYLCMFFVSILFFMVKVGKNHGKVYSNIFIRQICCLIALIIAEIIWTYFRYHQPILLTIKEGFYYIVPLFAFVTYTQYYNRDNNPDAICNIIIKVSIVSSVVALLAFILYTYAGVNFLQLADSFKDNFRNGTIRFGIGTPVVVMATIISITRFLRKEYSRIDIINVFFALIQIVVINKTRTLMLYMIMLILLSIIFGKKISKSLRLILIFLVAVCGMCVFFFSDSISSNLTDYFHSDAGIMIRFQTIEFYMEQFKEVPILGMGLISTSKNVANWQLMYGPAGYFYRDDVGIVGLLNKFGIAGLLWAVWFLKGAINKVKNLIEIHADIVRNLVIFCTITMINLCFMDYQRVMYIFVVMVICDAVIRKEMRKL